MLVYIFYRTDPWNTRSSEDLVYIGTNKEASIKKLMKLEDDPITEEQAADLRRILLYLPNRQMSWQVLSRNIQ